MEAAQNPTSFAANQPCNSITNRVDVPRPRRGHAARS